VGDIHSIAFKITPCRVRRKSREVHDDRDTVALWMNQRYEGLTSVDHGGARACRVTPSRARAHVDAAIRATTRAIARARRHPRAR
jgi:hypothetical protein